ncbi:MAG: hypothetical protein IOD12_10675 [Silvanigrellales bacterium]|nr:hypothetical protein [Silvanigrellales bacterium]
MSFHALRNAGSARSVGLAGSSVAYPGDDELAFGNPASTVWQRGLLGFRYASWSHDKAIPKLTGIDAGAQRGSQLAGSVRALQSAGASVGYTKSTAKYTRRVHERAALDLSLSSSDLPVMAAVKVHERVSLGGGMTFSSREYGRGAGEDVTSTTQRSRQSYAGRNWKLGLIGAVFDSLSVGFSYESARSLDRSGGEGDESTLPKRYVDPWVAKFGICYLLAPTESSLLNIENTFFLGADLVGFPEDAGRVRHAGATLLEEDAALAWPASKTLGATNASRYSEGQRLVPRIGIETAWFRTDVAELNTWVGSWWEPAYVEGREGAFHTTVGAQISLWALVVQAAADLSRDETRTILGAGLALR